MTETRDSVRAMIKDLRDNQPTWYMEIPQLNGQVIRTIIPPGIASLRCASRVLWLQSMLDDDLTDNEITLKILFETDEYRL